MHNNYKRLPMDGMYNTRDLGGYPAEGGRMTAYHRFLRTDMPYRLSDRDMAYLRELGLSTCIDLRSPYEHDKYPHAFHGDKQVKVHYVYMMEALAPQIEAVTEQDREEAGLNTLDKLYIYMADNCRDKIAEVFEIMAAAPEGIIMFNCTAGKDRTGIIAALLLGACGVHRADIISDYMVSEIYNRPIIEHLSTVAPEVNLAYHKSDPQNIERFLDHISIEHAHDYLLNCGLDRGKLKQITERLMG